jgi:exopolysaccharide biosynthesis polyprenyl glycosylphosphotransferase
MSNARRQILLNIFKLFDIALMASAFLLAAVAVMTSLHRTHAVTLTELFEMRVKIQNLAIFGLFMIAWHFVFSSFGLYKSRRLSDRTSEVLDVIKATSVGTMMIVVGAAIIHITLATPLFLLVFWAASTSAAVGSRLMLRVVLVWVRRRGRNLRDVLIVGTNGRAVQFAKKLQSHPEMGYRVVGFVDQDWSGIDAFRHSGHRLTCDFSGVPQYLRSSVVDEVVVALPMRSFHYEASRIAAHCEEQGITVRMLSNLFDLKLARSSAENWEGDALVTHTTGRLEGWPVVAKRMFDLVVSFSLLLLLSPLLVFTAVLIKLTSPGPVLFKQKRLGLNKRRFNIYKFRTMVVDAEQRMREVEHLNEVSGPVFKIKNDPRITPLGRFLRKTSIDELPQLLNVLLGAMSLVGPRPLPVRDYEGFNEDWQRRRFSVNPGITCLWQVQGRSSIAFEQWMQLDLQYIDKWSLWLDMQILVWTIPAILKGSGAA